MSVGLLVVAAVVHLWLAPEHFGEGSVQGTAFVLDGVALLGAGVWLLRTRSSAGAITAFGAATATAVFYGLSRTIGLPIFGREAWDLLGLATSAGELAGASLALVAAGPALSVASPHGGKTIESRERSATLDMGAFGEAGRSLMAKADAKGCLMRRSVTNRKEADAQSEGTRRSRGYRSWNQGSGGAEDAPARIETCSRS